MSRPPNAILVITMASMICLFTPGASGSGDWRNVDPVRDAIGERDPITSGLKLDLPMVSEDGGAISMGIAFQGNLEEGEHLESIRVFAARNPKAPVIDLELTSAVTQADFETRIRLAETQHVHAVAISNQNRVWSAAQEVRVTVSGCLMEDEDGASPSMKTPRVALGSTPEPGKPFPLRTMVNHPMETGLRDGEPDPDIEQQLVESMTVSQGERDLLRARFHTGTSANPYVQFHLTLDKADDLVVTWQDQKGDTVSSKQSLAF